MKQLLRKDGIALHAADDAARDALAKIKPGQAVYVELKRARNPRHHALYWALINLVFQNQERYQTPKLLHEAIKICVGLRTEIELPNGTKGFIPGSISYDAMGQDEFAEFFDRVVALVCKHIIPGMNEGDLKREVMSMVGVA